MDRKILWPLTVLLSCIAGYSAGWLTAPRGEDLSRSALEKAERMESLSISLGKIIETERGVRLELEEYVRSLEGNLRTATDTALEFEIKFGELSIRYREVEDKLAELGIQLNSITGRISGVTDDIGSFIDGAEGSQDAPAP
tara:strand:+ start:297 stop:719 length:423 start_codon:yes stop_codon:yes gene_type:complete